MGLIDAELRHGDDALIAAEDAAIIAAENVSPTVTDGTVSAPPGTPLADLIEALNADPPNVYSGPAS